MHLAPFCAEPGGTVALADFTALTVHRGWHIFCLKPPLQAIPEGDWSCPRCATYVKAGDKSEAGDTGAEEDPQSPECSDAEGTSVSAPGLDHSQASGDAVAELHRAWELSAAVQFAARFGPLVGLEPFSERELAQELAGAAAPASRGRLLTHLHLVLLAGQGLSRSMPLGAETWPAWLAKWIKRRIKACSDADGKESHALDEFCFEEEWPVGGPGPEGNASEETAAPGIDGDVNGAPAIERETAYDRLTPLHRLRLLQVLLCEKLDWARKHGLVEMDRDETDGDDKESEDEPGIENGSAAQKAEDADHVEGSNKADGRGEGVMRQAWQQWRARARPIATDAAGARYWYLGVPGREAQALCIFRSRRRKGAEGSPYPSDDSEEREETEDEEGAGGELQEPESEGLSSDEGEGAKCAVCGSGEDDRRLLLCDVCDDGFHLYCLAPPLARIPRDDEWVCPNCDDTPGNTRCLPRPPVPAFADRKAVETLVAVGHLSFRRVATRRPARAIRNGPPPPLPPPAWPPPSPGRSRMPSAPRLPRGFAA